MVQDPFHWMTSLNNDFINSVGTLGKIPGRLIAEGLDLITNTPEDLVLVTSLQFLPFIPAVVCVHDEQETRGNPAC